MQNISFPIIFFIILKKDIYGMGWHNILYFKQTHNIIKLVSSNTEEFEESSIKGFEGINTHGI
jgi:hypothetical protein